VPEHGAIMPTGWRPAGHFPDELSHSYQPFRGGWGIRCQYGIQSPKVIVIRPRSGVLRPEQLDLLLLTAAKPRISRDARRGELNTQLTQRRSLAEEPA
jgi:hypothetical protein